MVTFGLGRKEGEEKWKGVKRERRLAYMHREWDRGREGDGGCY